MPSPSPPLAGLAFSLVGPGRVGSSLASWIVELGGTLVHIAGRSEDSARELAARLGGRTSPLEDLVTENEELLLIAVSDSALADVGTLLARRSQAKVALHTSGLQAAGVLQPLARRGTATGSLHPLKAFPSVLPSVETAAGGIFAVDGEKEAQQLARRLIAAWSGEAVEIPAESRLLYHLAASLAAGGVVTLVATACELASAAGLPEAVRRGYFDLARGALEQAAAPEDPAAAVTGPVARGDLETLKAQLERLQQVDPERTALVVALARETLGHLQRRGELGTSHEAMASYLEAFSEAHRSS